MPLFNMADRILFVSVSVQMWQVFSIRHELDSNQALITFQLGINYLAIRH